MSAGGSPRHLIALGTQRLIEAGVPSPEHDARALLQHVLGTERPLVMIDLVSEADGEAYFALVARRMEREPLQFIVGEVTFRYSTLLVGHGAFIPRPETEIVTGVAIDAARAVNGPARIVDLCTGSGAIAAAIADEAPTAQVWGVELSEDALRIAQTNLIHRHVALVHADAAVALPELDGTVDVVVSNPPYIPDGAVPRDREVTRWDPPLALYGGGPDGEVVPRAVAERAAGLLREGGVFVMEHGDVQGAAMRRLVAATGAFSGVVTGEDMTGRDRYVRAVRRPRDEDARLAP